MTSSKLDELRKDVEELNKLFDLAMRSKVKDILLIETRRIETEIMRLKEQDTDQNKKELSKDSSGIVQNQKPVKCYDVRLTNYAWDQSDKFVKIFIDLKGVQTLPNEKIVCEFLNTEMTLNVKELNNRNYCLTIKNLTHCIVPGSSRWKVKEDMITILMLKENEKKHWKSLTGKEKADTNLADLDPNADPNQGLINIMKKMYEEGDDETKRSIAKAWCERQNDGTPVC